MDSIAVALNAALGFVDKCPEAGELKAKEALQCDITDLQTGAVKKILADMEARMKSARAASQDKALDFDNVSDLFTKGGAQLEPRRFKLHIKICI